MSKRNYIIERASDVNGGQYVQTNPSYNSGYEDGKKAGKEYCAAELAALRGQVEKLKALVVMRCDLDVPPQFSQGLQSHEVLEPVTAEHCQWFVAEIEKLRKERDTEIARNRPLQSLIKSTEKTKSFLLKKSEENKEAVKQLDSERQANAVLTEELAALAEQNEKMRKVLLRLACLGNGDQYGNSIGNCIAQEALSLPDLATPVLNQIKAEVAEQRAVTNCAEAIRARMKP